MRRVSYSERADNFHGSSVPEETSPPRDLPDRLCCPALLGGLPASARELIPLRHAGSGQPGEVNHRSLPPRRDALALQLALAARQKEALIQAMCQPPTYCASSVDCKASLS
uniref:OAR domain-containing protein n=1 Tax=Angiostrongylus cantonensis TaxID=6313 RepID=A0A0K0DJ65_ANGCA